MKEPGINTNSPLEQMKIIYQDGIRFLSDREKAKREEERYVGCLGNDVPEEILIAAGFVPIWIQGKSFLSLEDADQYLEYSFNPVIRAQFQRLADGTYKPFIDHLVISNSSDTLVRIYYYLREMRRIEPDKAIPEPYFHDILFTQRRMHQVYNYSKISKFKAEVERWSGRTITSEDLEQAIAVCNKNRRLLQEVSKYRLQGKLHGSDCAAVYGSSLLMPKAEHNELLQALLSEMEDAPDVAGARILLVGSVHEEETLYLMVEECGGNIVFEDHDWGDRLSDLMVEEKEDLLAAVSDRYMLRTPSAKKSFVSQRVEALKRHMEQVRPDGVIFFNRIYDDPASWDYPEQAKLLQERQVPYIACHAMPYDLRNEVSLRERISELIQNMNKGVD